MAIMHYMRIRHHNNISRYFQVDASGRKVTCLDMTYEVEFLANSTSVSSVSEQQ